jgi:hypothetical protein
MVAAPSRTLQSCLAESHDPIAFDDDDGGYRNRCARDDAKKFLRGRVVREKLNENTRLGKAADQVAECRESSERHRSSSEEMTSNHSRQGRLGFIDASVDPAASYMVT